MHVETDLGPEASAFVKAMLESGRFPGVDRLLDRAVETLASAIDDEREREAFDRRAEAAIRSGNATPHHDGWWDEVEAGLTGRRSA